MTPLTALLCLGLSMGTRSPEKAGTQFTPTFWAEPGSVIPWGHPVTLWCQGVPGAQEFCMDKERSPGSLGIHMTLQPGDKANFSIGSLTSQHAGTYRCYYRSPTGWSKLSNSVELVVTAPGPDHTVENLVRLALSGFILLLLGALVLEAWHSQRGIPQRTQRPVKRNHKHLSSHRPQHHHRHNERESGSMAV